MGIEVEQDQLRPINRLGVVGAGFIGAAIAGVAALQARVDVRVCDTDHERVANGIRGARRIFDDRKKRRRLDQYESRR